MQLFKRLSVNKNNRLDYLLKFTQARRLIKNLRMQIDIILIHINNGKYCFE